MNIRLSVSVIKALGIIAAIGGTALPALAGGHQRSLLEPALKGEVKSGPKGRLTVIPLVCNPDQNPAVGTTFVSKGKNFTLQLDDAGDVNDIVGALINGAVSQPLQSVQIEFSGPAAPPNGGPVPEGPNIFVLGNDAQDNGVLALANALYPSQQTILPDGFKRQLFLNTAFETVETTDPSGQLNPVVKIIAIDVETSGLSSPVYMRNVMVNRNRSSVDVNPSDALGCLLIPSPF